MSARSANNPFAGSHTGGVRAVYKGMGGAAKNLQPFQEIDLDSVKKLKHPSARPKHGGEAKQGGHDEGTWIYSFADLIMNLLMFFVMLFAISSIDKSKLSQIQEAFSSYSKQSAKKVEKTQNQDATDNQQSAATLTFQSTTRSAKKLSDADILEEMQKLASLLNIEALSKHKKLSEDLKDLEKKVKAVAPQIESKWKSDPLADAMEVVFDRGTLLTNSFPSQVTVRGRSSLVKLAKELKDLNRDLAVQVRSLVPNKSIDPQTMAQGSVDASLVLAEILKTYPIPPERASASSYGGELSYQKEDANSRGRIVVRIGLSPRKEAL